MSYYLMPRLPYNEDIIRLYKNIKPFFINYLDKDKNDCEKNTTININNTNTNTTKRIHNIKINNSLYDFLAVIKQEIDCVQTQWDNIKKYTNSYEFIHTNVPGTKHAVSKLKPLSRSYYKMIEICKLLNILNDYSLDSITSFHLAEGPGGFVEALCHMRENKNDCYHAMTLLDDSNDCVPGWRKSMLFLEKHKNVKIEYGITKDGDLLKKENLIFYYEQFKNSCDIVTGDGGFDFSVNFNNQETMCSTLIFSQIAFAVACQKKGGTFILKVFDTFSELSIQFIYLLSTMYEKVYIVKPNTSRQANSEKYIVCQYFRLDNVSEYIKIFINILSVLESFNNKSIDRLFDDKIKIPVLFLTKLEEINSIYGQQQIESITSTLSLIKKINNNYSEKYKLDKLKNQNIVKCIYWCEKFSIPFNRSFNTNNFLRE